MILNPRTGGPLTKRTKASFPPALFDQLRQLSDTLSMQGIALVCVRCQQPIQGSNHPSDPTYYLDCVCARRTFDRTAGRQSAVLHEAVRV